METVTKKSSSDFLTWDINTTGRRLIDEICQISAYLPDVTFNQYVMPHRDIDYNARKRYLLKTVNIGVYRALRETVSGKVLKTKSEVSALTDFVAWLEERRISADNKRIVLMYYENFTPAPFILIESLKKFHLLARFKESVAGFANCFDFIKAKCEKSMQTYSIKSLAKILLNKDHDKPYDASERVRILYEIVAHLCVGESQFGHEDLEQGLGEHVSTVEDIESGIAEMKLILSKQNSLKPIFGPLIRLDRKRREALILRRHLTNADIDYETLKGVWNKNEEMKLFLKNHLRSDVKEEDLIELDSVILKHFSDSSRGAQQNTTTIDNTTSKQGNATTGYNTDKIHTKINARSWKNSYRNRRNPKRKPENTIKNDNKNDNITIPVTATSNDVDSESTIITPTITAKPELLATMNLNNSTNKDNAITKP